MLTDSTLLAGLTDVHRDAYHRLVRMGERRETDDELIAKSRMAVLQSFATLARVPELSFVGRIPRLEQAEAARSRGRDEAPWSSRAWVGLEARSDLRFFFDVDDGEVSCRDEVGIVLASEDDVPRETKAILFDLAQTAIPEGRPRLFTARVRDQSGKCIYKGLMRMKPLPAIKPDRDSQE